MCTQFMDLYHDAKYYAKFDYDSFFNRSTKLKIREMFDTKTFIPLHWMVLFSTQFTFIRTFKWL